MQDRHKNHNIEKRYYEYLAKQILESYLPQKYKNLILSDRPDLRMDSRYGIEVTRVLYPSDAEVMGIFKSVANKHIDCVDKRRLAALAKRNARLLKRADGTIYSVIPGSAQLIAADTLTDAYDKKVEKYQVHPLETDQNDLFMYSPIADWFGEYIIEDFMHKVCETHCCPFNTIMVFEYSYLYSYHFSSKTFTKISISADALAYSKFCECTAAAKHYALNNNVTSR